MAGLAAGLAVLAALPWSGDASETALEALLGDEPSLVAGSPLGEAVQAPASTDRLRLRSDLEEELNRLRLRESTSAAPAAAQQEDPKTQPPMHGTNPHGQGTVGVVDLQPDPARPQGGDPAGSDSGEEIVVGRARGEQRDDGTYHGHVTILALFGQEILGVDTAPGQTEAGPLDAVQQGVLNPLCNGTGNQVCITAVTADSNTTDNGSTNRFSAAHVTVGGANGIDAGAAESNGNISSDGTCQTAHGDSSVASARVGGQAVADLAQSSTESKACKGQAPTQTNASTVLALGGTGVPLPAAGCAVGEEVVTGIPTVAPVVCNGDDTSGTQAGPPYGVREALGVYLLDSGGSQASKATTAASESRAQAPPPQCSDKIDNDGDGKIDPADPGCLSGPGGTYNPNDDNETDEAALPQCSDKADNDGDGKIDATDPGCLSGPGGTYDPNDNDERDPAVATQGGGGGGDRADRPECSDREDNDGDGRADARDPGCLSGPGGTYDPDDDDESDGGAASLPECSDGADNDGDGTVDRDDPGCLSGPGGSYDPLDDSEADARRELGALALTGVNALLLGMGGLLTLAAGLVLRRRTEPGVPA